MAGQYKSYYTPSQEEPLPPGWEMLMDKTSGLPFYVNHNTQKTQWTRPEPASYPRPAAPPQYSQVYPHQQQQPQGRVREIPVIRETRSDSPRRSQTPTRIDQPMPHQGSPSQRVYNIPVQYVDRSDQEALRHGSPIRHFEGRNSPRSASPWEQERSQVGGGETGPHSWSTWVGGSSPQPRQPRGMPHHPAQQTPPFPVDNPPQTYTYPGGNMGPSGVDNGIRIQYPQGIVNTHCPSNSPPQHGTFPRQPAEHNQSREIPITKVPPPEPQSTNGQTVQYRVEENEMDDVTLKRDDTPPRPTHRNTANLVAEDRSATRSPSPAPAHLTPLEQVELIASEINSLQENVNSFDGKMKDKGYKYIEEMLTRCMLKLDRIESQGKDEVRMARKAAIRSVQSKLDQLELKAFASDTVIAVPEEQKAQQDGTVTAESAKGQEAAPVSEETGAPSAPTAKQTDTRKQNSSCSDKDPSHVSDMVIDAGINC